MRLLLRSCIHDAEREVLAMAEFLYYYIYRSLQLNEHIILLAACHNWTLL